MLRNPPLFKIIDLKPNTTELSMVWINLMSSFNGNDGLEISLGDVALRNGIANAWHLADALPIEFKHYIVASIRPSLYRAFFRTKIQEKYIKDCKRLLCRYSKGKTVWERSLSDICQKLETSATNKDFSVAAEFSLSAAYQLIRYLSVEPAKGPLIRLAAMNILNTVEPGDREVESQQQIVDVCKVFPPAYTRVEIE